MKRISRLLRIFYVLQKYRIDDIIGAEILPPSLRWLYRISPLRLLPKATSSRGQRIRQSFEELGPIFIKFGQMLSTRRDLLPDDIADELQHLQDNVPPFPSDQAVRLIESALGEPVDELFAEFNPQPLASASVAQVHEATLPGGEKVVVKVLRPKVESIIAKDLELLETLAGLMERYSDDGRRLRPKEVVSDYAKTIWNELDLQIEAGNTSQLKRNFENSPLLYVPGVYWEYTRKNILVIDRIYGIPVADIDALNAQNTDMKKLAERGVEVFFTQVFRDSFFHADMHPGNIFVSREDPSEPQYIAIDCAIVGSLSAEDKHYLARILLAFFKRDYRQVALLHVQSGWVAGTTPVSEFETAIRSVCEPIFEKPLKDISFGQVLLRLFQTARRFNMEIQPQLVLLQKTLLNIEGLGRQIYPDLDLWNTAKPFMEEWVKERSGPVGLIKAIKEQGPEWLEQSSEVPRLLMDTMQQFSSNKDLHERNEKTLELLSKQLSLSQKQSSNTKKGVLLLALGTLTAIEASPLAINTPIISALIAAMGLMFMLR